MAYATVGPIACLNGALVFLPPSLAAMSSLPNIDLIAFGAYVFVYPRLFSRVNFTYIFATKYIFKFSAGCEACVYSCFSE